MIESVIIDIALVAHTSRKIDVKCERIVHLFTRKKMKRATSPPRKQMGKTLETDKGKASVAIVNVANQPTHKKTSVCRVTMLCDSIEVQFSQVRVVLPTLATAVGLRQHGRPSRFQ